MGRRFAAQAGGKTSSSRPYLLFSLAIALMLLERRAGRAASALLDETGPAPGLRLCFPQRFGSRACVRCAHTRRCAAARAGAPDSPNGHGRLRRLGIGPPSKSVVHLHLRVPPAEAPSKARRMPPRMMPKRGRPLQSGRRSPLAMAPSSSERHQGRAARAAEGLQPPLAQAPTASGHRRLPPSRRLAGRAQLVLLLDTETMASVRRCGPCRRSAVAVAFHPTLGPAGAGDRHLADAAGSGVAAVDDGRAA